MLRTYVRLYREAITGLPRATWLLSAVTLVNRAGTMVIPFLALYFATEIEGGLDKPTVGVLLGLYGVGTVLGSIGGGWLSDHVGALTIQAGSLILTGLGFFVLRTCDTWLSLAIALPILGMIQTMMRPASWALLTSTCPPEMRTRALALFRLAINLGMAIGPATGGVLAETSFDHLFVVDGTACLIAGLLLVVLFRGKSPTIDEPDSEEKSDRSPWRDGLFLIVTTNTFVLALVVMQWMSTGTVFLENEYGLSKSEIGFLLGMNPVIIVALEMIISHKLAERPPLRWIAFAGYLVAISCVMLPFGSTFAWAAVSVVIWTIAEMIESPLAGAFVANRAGPKNRGRYMGVYTMSFAITTGLAPLAGFWIYDRFGSTTLWMIAGVAAALVSTVIYALARTTDRTSTAP